MQIQKNSKETSESSESFKGKEKWIISKIIREGANHFSSRIFQDIWKRMDDDDI